MSNHRTPYRYKVPIPREVKYSPDFARYAKEKAEWQWSHPNATKDELQEAIRHIATRCGI